MVSCIKRELQELNEKEIYDVVEMNTFGSDDIRLFGELLDNGYCNELLCEELFKKPIIAVKRYNDKVMYYYYDSIKDCSRANDFKNDIHDVFIMCKRSQGVKEEWVKLKYLHKSVGTTKFYFSEDIKLPKNVLFENYGKGLQIINDQKREQAKEKRRKKLAAQRAKKVREKNIRECKRCGKQLKAGYGHCADCKIIIQREKAKENAIKQGKEIKICSICGKEHWRKDIDCCSPSCNKRWEKHKKSMNT